MTPDDGLPVHLTLPGVPLVSTTILASHVSSMIKLGDLLLSPHALIRSTMLPRERHATLSGYAPRHYYFYCHR